MRNYCLSIGRKSKIKNKNSRRFVPSIRSYSSSKILINSLNTIGKHRPSKLRLFICDSFETDECKTNTNASITCRIRFLSSLVGRPCDSRF